MTELEKELPSLLKKNAIKIKDNKIHITPSGYKMYANLCEEEILAQGRKLTDLELKGLEDLQKGLKTEYTSILLKSVYQKKTQTTKEKDSISKC